MAARREAAAAARARMKEELERELGVGAALSPAELAKEKALEEKRERDRKYKELQAQKKAAEKKRREAAALKSQQRQQGGAATVAAKASDRGKGETTRGGSDRWPGYPLHELRGHGYSPVQLRFVGHSAADLKAGGYDVTELKAAGFNAHELKAAKFRAADLRAVGFHAKDLRAARFRPVDLRNAGFTVQELREVDLSAAEMKSAGYTLEEMQEDPVIYRHYSCSAMNLFGYDDDGAQIYHFRDGTLPLLPDDLMHRGAKVKRFGEDMQRRKRILQEIKLMQEEPTHVADPSIMQVSFLPGDVDPNLEVTIEALREVARAIKQHWGPTRSAACRGRRVEIVNLNWLLPPELKYAEADILKKSGTVIIKKIVKR